LYRQYVILIPDMQSCSPGLATGSRAVTRLLLSFSSIHSVILFWFLSGIWLNVVLVKSKLEGDKPIHKDYVLWSQTKI